MPRIDAVWYDVEARYGGLETGLNQAKTRLASFAAFIVGSPAKAAAAFAATVVLIGVAAAKMAVEFDTSMRRAVAGLPDAAAKLDALKASVLDLSGRLPFTAEQLALGMRKITEVSAGELGGNVDAMAKRLEIAGRIALVTGQDISSIVDVIDTAGDAFGRAGNVFAEQFVNMAYGASNTFIGFQELGSMISRVGTFAANAGVPMEQLAAYIVAVAERGVPARLAMMGLRRAFNDTSVGADETAEEFIKAGDMLGKLGLKVRVVDGNLVGAVTTTEQFTTSLHNAAEGAGRVTEALSLLTSGAANQATLVRNELNAAMIEFGTRTLPLVTAELRGVVGLLDLLSGRVAAIGLNSAAATMNTLAVAVERFRRSGEEMPEGVLQRLAEAAGQVSRAMGPMEQASTAALQSLHRALRATGDVNLATIIQRTAIEAELVRRGQPQINRGPGITPIVVTTRPITVTDPAAASAAAKARLDLLNSLRDRIAETMGDAYSITMRQLDAIEAQFREKFGHSIPDEVTRGLARLRDEAGGDLALAPYDDAMAALVEKTRTLTENAHATTEEYLAQLTAFNELRASLEAGLADTTLSVAAHGRIRTMLGQIADLEQQVLAAKKGQASTGKTLAKQDEDRLGDLQAQARNIEAAARGALQLASAFGLVDDESARALENIVQIAANLPAALAGNVGSILSVAGGIASLVEGLFGGREESPQQVAARKAMQDNTWALQVLAGRIEELGIDTSGGEFTGIKKAITSALASPGFGYAGGGPAAEQILGNLLAGQGMLMQDLVALAGRFNIRFAGSIPTVSELRALLEAMGIAEKAGPGGGATAGVTQQWGVNRTITEATASRQLSLMTTMAYWLEVIGGDTGIMAGRLAPPDATQLAAFGARASGGGLTVGELSVTVQVTVGAGVDGQAIGQAVGAATAEEINRQLYKAAAQRVRALGQASLN